MQAQAKRKLAQDEREKAKEAKYRAIAKARGQEAAGFEQAFDCFRDDMLTVHDKTKKAFIKPAYRNLITGMLGRCEYGKGVKGIAHNEFVNYMYAGKAGRDMMSKAQVNKARLTYHKMIASQPIN